MLTLDHIAIACTDLSAGVAWVEDQLGVTMVPGGQHPRYGTHNALLGIGDLYLEVIAKDPDAAPTGRAAWFALDHFSGPPRPANWICRSDDLATDVSASPAGIGQVVPLTRGDLHWQITVPDDGSLPMQGAWPTLIKWGDGTTHPTQALPDTPCRLIRWEVTHPQAAQVQADLALHDDRVVFQTGPTCAFRAVISGPKGQVVLS